MTENRTSAFRKPGASSSYQQKSEMDGVIKSENDDCSSAQAFNESCLPVPPVPVNYKEAVQCDHEELVPITIYQSNANPTVQTDTSVMPECDNSDVTFPGKSSDVAHANETIQNVSIGDNYSDKDDLKVKAVKYEYDDSVAKLSVVSLESGVSETQEEPVPVITDPLTKTVASVEASSSADVKEELLDPVNHHEFVTMSPSHDQTIEAQFANSSLESLTHEPDISSIESVYDLTSIPSSGIDDQQNSLSKNAFGDIYFPRKINDISILREYSNTLIKQNEIISDYFSVPIKVEDDVETQNSLLEVSHLTSTGINSEDVASRSTSSTEEEYDISSNNDCDNFSTVSQSTHKLQRNCSSSPTISPNLEIQVLLDHSYSSTSKRVSQTTNDNNNNDELLNNFSSPVTINPNLKHQVSVDHPYSLTSKELAPIENDNSNECLHNSSSLITINPNLQHQVSVDHSYCLTVKHVSQLENNKTNNCADNALKMKNKKQLEKLTNAKNILSCNIVDCSASFSCISDLVAHRQTHEVVNPKEHKCHYSGCNLTFKRECSLKTHVKTHEAINENSETHSDSDGSGVDSDVSYSSPSDGSDLDSDSSCSGKEASLNDIPKATVEQTKKSPKNLLNSKVIDCMASCSYSSDIEAPQPSHSRSDPEGGIYKCHHTGCDLTFKRMVGLNTHLETHETLNNMDDSGSDSLKRADFAVSDSDPDSSDLESDSADLDSDSSGHSKKEKHSGCTSLNKVNALQVDKSSNDPKRPYKCDHPHCTWAFTKSSYLRKHKRTHTGVKPHKCPFIGCNRAYSHKSHVQEHLAIHIGYKPHKCHICNKSFTYRSALNTHLRIHKGTKPYKCYYKGCGAKFTAASSAILKAHQKTHTGEKPFKCDFPGCQAAFTEPAKIRKHKLIHDPNKKKPFKCEFEGCNLSFVNKNYLKIHHRTHTGEKPFKCGHEGCVSAFKTRQGLQLHIRMHTGEKPFKCQYDGCKSAFRDLEHLQRHELTHTGIKPYKCDYVGCGLKFSQSCSLSRHKRTHTGEKPYKCDFASCNAEFAQSFPLTLHKRSHK